MLVNIIKLIHLLFALSLLGLTTYLSLLVATTNFSLGNAVLYQKILRLNKHLLIFAFCAMLTGTLLVYPKNFSFHTPWIQAAYLFVTIFSVGILGLIWAKKTFVLQHRGMWFCSYLALLMILLIVVHDAVTKTTVW
jgi:hypothetical protein